MTLKKAGGREERGRRGGERLRRDKESQREGEIVFEKENWTLRLIGKTIDRRGGIERKVGKDNNLEKRM